VSGNPFRIGSHVTGRYFTDRAPEVKRIRQAMREPTRLLVFGPRRMGKSSAIAVAAARARRDGILVVRADLATASSLVDVGNRLLRSLSRQRKRERLAELAAALAPSVSLTFDAATGEQRVVFGMERRGAAEDVQRRSLEQVIEALGRMAAERERVAVVLDEFQAVRRFGGEEAEWYLRDLMQRHGALSFICAGSEVSLIEEMLGPNRAFFRAFELLRLGPLPAKHLARWLESRLGTSGVRAEGVGPAIVERSGPRTQDILQVASHVYARGVARGAVTLRDVDAAIRDVVHEEDPVIRALWTELTTHQQNVLRVVAASVEHVFSSATRRRFSLSTSSTVATAVDALLKRGVLTRDAAGGTIRFDSPFVRLWVEWEALPDVPPAS